MYVKHTLQRILLSSNVDRLRQKCTVKAVHK